MYKEIAPGELIVANSAVVLQDKVWSTLRHVEKGTLELPRNELVEGWWIAEVDDYCPRRRDLPLDLLSSGGTSATALVSATRVNVYSISSGTDYIRHDQYRATVASAITPIPPNMRFFGV